MTDLAFYREFRKGDATAHELQKVVDEVLAELAEPESEACVKAQAVGLRPGDLQQARVQIREGAQGVEPISTTILVGIAITAGGKVAESLWKDVLWPRLRRRLGVTAVKEPVEDSQPTAGS